MRERGYGQVINIASLQSTRAFPNGLPGASKGVCQLTRAMAEAWSRDGICCNALAPGFFPTELTTAVFGNDESRDWRRSKPRSVATESSKTSPAPRYFLPTGFSLYHRPDAGQVYRQMKALVYTANQEMTYREEPEPQAQSGDALIGIESVGVQFGYTLGHDERQVPLILGHEASVRYWKARAAGVAWC